MATGLEAVGAAATIISVIGFSAQVFDGCIKGFVLLSTAHNLGRDAEILRSMLDWEQFRLEQWAEKVGLQDPAKADILMDWKLITETLQHIKHLTSDVSALKEKYHLVLVERARPLDPKPTDQDNDQASMNRFKRLFGQTDKFHSTAAAKVIQSKNSRTNKLWWAAVDKDNLKRLIDDIAHFVQRLHDLLNLSIQAQMQKSIDLLLQKATTQYSNVPDLEVLRELAVRARYDPPGYERTEDGEIAEEVEKKFRNLLFSSISKGDTDQVQILLDKGCDVQTTDVIGWPPLVRAAEAGRLAVVQLLLNRGANPIRGTIGDRLPLHFAAENGHGPVVRLLLNQPTVDPNKKDYQGQTALFKAAGRGHHMIVEMLLEKKGIEPDAVSKDGFTPLLQAIFKAHEAVIRLLLDRSDVNPNQCDLSHKQIPLWMAVTAGEAIFRMVLERNDVEVNRRSRWGETPLYRAIQRSRLVEAQMLLKANADPNLANDNAETPLSWAAAEGSQESLELLIQQPTIALELMDGLGRTPLARAADNGHTKAVRILLGKGANTESLDNGGCSPLCLAAANGHKVVVKLLLKSNAQINAQNRKGNTPLALAAENNHDAVVRLLLENGADPELADEDEETPFEKARDRHIDRIVDIFKEIDLQRRPTAPNITTDSLRTA